MVSGAPVPHSALPDIPVEAGARPRQPRGARSPLLRALTWTLPTVLIAATVGTVLFLHRGDAEGAARVANAELDAMLVPRESVLRRAPVTQRNWWDWFRVTHGVLAATDRRLLYVGVPPEPVLPREPEPLPLVVLSVTYDRPIVVTGVRVFLNTSPGIVLSGPWGRTLLGVAPTSAARVDSVLATVEARKNALQVEQDAERRASEATLAAARRAITHLVQGGESLEGIAARYGTTTDSLRAWNQLATDRITAGRRLIVRPER